jgi:hypothetical protein
LLGGGRGFVGGRRGRIVGSCGAGDDGPVDAPDGGSFGAGGSAFVGG